MKFNVVILCKDLLIGPNCVENLTNVFMMTYLISCMGLETKSQTDSMYVGCEVFTVMTMKNAIF
jgi:hypothetical protein